MSKNVVNILALTMIVVLMWVAFQIFKYTTAQPVPQATARQLEVLNPNLDTAVIEDLNNPEKTLK
jgi:hypothetical protein